MPRCHRNGKRWTAGQGLPWCPLARWRLISMYRFSRCCWTSSRPCSLCNKAGLRVFNLLFNAMSRFTRSSFTRHWFPDVISSSLCLIRCVIRRRRNLCTVREEERVALDARCAVTIRDVLHPPWLYVRPRPVVKTADIHKNSRGHLLIYFRPINRVS